MAKIQLDENSRIIIYGAGNYAEKLYWYLKFRRISNLVDYVVVSDMEDHEEFFHGLRIFNLSEKKDDIINKQIIVAVSTPFSRLIQEKLVSLGVKDIVTLSKEFINDLQNEFFRLCSQFPVDRNKILFNAYNGSGYTCNCKYIAERILKIHESTRIIWDVIDSTLLDFPPSIVPISRNSPEYIYEISTAAIVVFNATIYFDIPFKRKEQYFINTWHGIGPFKKVGKSLASLKSGEIKPEYKRIQDYVDLMTAASDHCVDVYRNSIGYQGEIQKWGYPRNDVFFGDTGIRDRIFERYDIDKNRRLVLYAPTYRYNLQNADATEVMQTYDIDPRELVKALEKRYKKSFVFLYRFHHLIFKSTNVARGVYGYGIDVTTHPDMQELLVAADVLITDWSSSIWDFSLTRKQGKRVFLYQNDIERATELNGFYMPPDQLPFPKGRTTEELCEAILTYDDEQYMRDVDAFFDKYGCYDDGHASERVAERIIDVIEHPEKYGKEGKS